MSSPTVTGAATTPAPAASQAPAAPAGPAGHPAPGPAAAQPGGLARVFAAVAPARPATPIATTAALRQNAASDVGAPAAGSGTGDTKGRTATGAAAPAAGDGPFGALLRALATRLARTGNARTTRRTHEIKEQRASGSTSTASNTTKADRTEQHRNDRDTKLADLNNKTAQHSGQHKQDTKNHRDHAAKTDQSARNDRSAKNDASARRDHSGRDHNDRAAKSDSSDHHRSTKSNSTDHTDRADRTAKNGTADRGDRSGKNGPADRRADQAPQSPPAGPQPKTPTPAGTGGTNTTGNNSTADKTSRPPKTGSAPSRTGDGRADVPGGGQNTKPATTPPGPTIRTRPSREAGFRDGTRAAAVVGHVKAYRDGTRDGWDHRTAKDTDDKHRMDTARDTNALALKPDLAKKLQPVLDASSAKLRTGQEKPATPGDSKTPPPADTGKAAKPASTGQDPDVKQDPATEARGTAAAASTDSAGPAGRNPKTKPNPEATAKDAAAAPDAAPAEGPGPTLAKSPGAPDPAGQDPDSVSVTKNQKAPVKTTTPDPAQNTPWRPTRQPATASMATAQTTVQTGTDAAGPMPGPRTGNTPPPGPPATTGPRSEDPPPVPAQVLSVGEEAIQYADGATGEIHTASRREVRTLKAFQRRLAEKAGTLERLVESSRSTVAEAEAQAKQAQDLLAAAKGVKGGETVVRALSRLAEASQGLRTKALAVQRGAGRSSEQVRRTVLNADVRHGGIYQAVVDSPLTAPAERSFYLDSQGQ